TDNVGLDAVIIQREHLARATHAALDLIDNQKNAVLVTDAAQLAEESLRSGHITAFALDGLDDDGRDLGWRRRRLKQAVLDPIHRSLNYAAVATIFGIERVPIFIRIRHVDHVERLALEPETLRGL